VGKTREDFMTERLHKFTSEITKILTVDQNVEACNRWYCSACIIVVFDPLYTDCPNCGKILVDCSNDMFSTAVKKNSKLLVKQYRKKI
jgi:hypothetical protein